jgi:dehydrogenase/reductase SDR family protein 7B
MAVQCLQHGAFVIISSRSEARLQATKELLLSSVGADSPSSTALSPSRLADRIKVLPLDLTVIANDYASAEKLAAQANAAFCKGKVDVLINNGGISMRGRVEDTDIKVDRQVFDVNFFGTIALTKACLPAMLAQREGRVVVVSSLQGKFGVPERAAYSASKHALHGWYDALQLEVEDRGVQVVVACPGYVNTNLASNALTASGGQHGQASADQLKGWSAERMAAAILRHTAQGSREVLLAKWLHRMAVYLKTLAPAFLQYAPLFCFSLMHAHTRAQIHAGQAIQQRVERKMILRNCHEVANGLKYFFWGNKQSPHLGAARRVSARNHCVFPPRR